MGSDVSKRSVAHKFNLLALEALGVLEVASNFNVTCLDLKDSGGAVYLVIFVFFNPAARDCTSIGQKTSIDQKTPTTAFFNNLETAFVLDHLTLRVNPFDLSV